ncbi:hypothetical protein OAR16_00055 [bacterium]|nr:hypothetical protein [bacterium]
MKETILKYNDSNLTIDKHEIRTALRRELGELHAFFTRLHQALPCPHEGGNCSECGEKRLRECNKGMDDILVDLISSMQKQFQYEEDIMREMSLRRNWRSLFEDHQEAHADMMQDLVAIIGDGSQLNKERFRLGELFTSWLRHHETYDIPLLEGCAGAEDEAEAEALQDAMQLSHTPNAARLPSPGSAPQSPPKSSLKS